MGYYSSGEGSDIDQQMARAQGQYDAQLPEDFEHEVIEPRDEDDARDAAIERKELQRDREIDEYETIRHKETNS